MTFSITGLDALANAKQCTVFLVVLEASKLEASNGSACAIVIWIG